MQTKFFLYPPLTINVSSLFSRNWVRIWGTKSAKCNVSGTSINTSFRVPAVNLSSTSSMLRKNAQVTKRGTFRGWSLSFLLWTMACFNRLDSFFRLKPDEGVFSRSLIEVSGDSVTSLEVSVETFSSSSSYKKVKMYVNRSMARLHSWTFFVWSSLFVVQLWYHVIHHEYKSKASQLDNLVSNLLSNMNFKIVLFFTIISKISSHPLLRRKRDMPFGIWSQSISISEDTFCPSSTIKLTSTEWKM